MAIGLSGPPRRTRRRAAFAIYVIVLLSVAALTVGEIIARRATVLRGGNLDWATIREQFRLVPYLQYGCEPYDPHCVERSFLGWTIDWPSEPDLVILGGSTAEGTGASELEATYFQRLAHLSGLTVVPAARSGYVSAQEMNMLALQVLPRAPRRVLLLSGLNDISVPSGAGVPASYPINWRLAQQQGSPLVWLGRHSGLVNLWVQWASLRDVFRGQTVPGAGVADIARAWRINFAAMAAMCRGAGVPLAFVLQPHGDLARLRSMGRLPASHPYQDLRNTIAAACKEEGVPFLDATYAVDPERFNDPPAHFDDEGHDQLAQFLWSNLGSWWTEERSAGTEALPDAPAGEGHD